LKYSILWFCLIPHQPGFLRHAKFSVTAQGREISKPVEDDGSAYEVINQL
jgi:hypothetical protein